MKGISTLILLLALLCTGTTRLFSQIELQLHLQPDGKTFTVSARSSSDFLPPLGNLVTEAQVTVVVPTGALELENLQNHAGQWAFSHLIEHPAGNSGADYAVFNLSNATSDAVFEQGVAVPLFSFENEKGCSGAFEILDHFNDPLFPHNPMNLPLGNTFMLEGAGGDAYIGNYGQGSANCFAQSNCLLTYHLELIAGGFYQITLKADPLWLADTIASLQVAIKVPSGFFEASQLASLQPNSISFSGISRFDSPAEVPDFDYLQFKLAANGQGIVLQPGMSLPLLKFANEGSCQGDSIFLVNNTDDGFMPPNTQGAAIGQQVVLKNGTVVNSCLGTRAASCTGCLFTANTLVLDSVQKAGPIACLGMPNGMIKLFASGADDIEYSLDGGQTWTDDGYFNGLISQVYQPMLRGIHYGCLVQMQAAEVALEDETGFSLHLDVPSNVCKGDDVGLQILAPNPLPPNTQYQWSGPNGFSSTIPDPAILNTGLLQSGIYSLTVQVPGCQSATATSQLQVVQPPGVPTLISNAPLCQGDALVLTTDVDATLYEWISPAGQSGNTLALPGLTTNSPNTEIPFSHTAYLPGNWKVRVTDIYGCTAESGFIEVGIKARPQAFATNNGPVCYGQAAELSGNPLPGAVYFWRRQGETAVYSMQQNPVLANVTSEQAFELQVALNGCLSDNNSITTIGLHPKPSAFPEYSYQMAPDCSPADLQFKANAVGIGLSFLWTGANGFVSQMENPTISSADAANNGSYLLEVTNFFGCKTSNPFQVSGLVDALPTPVVQNSGSACPGGDIQLAVQPYNHPSVSYHWFRNNSPIFGATSNLLNLNGVQTVNEGNYKLKAIVGDCVLTSAETIVDVLTPPSPEPSFYLTQNCEGGALQFFSNTAGIASWHWSGPDGFDSNSPTPIIYNTEFSDIGAYTLTVFGINGCSASESVVVDGILPVPETPLVVTNSPVCPEDAIVLTVQNPVLAGNVFYEWQNGDGIPVGTGEPTLALATGDTLAVPPFLVKTIHNTCASAFSEPIPVEVKPWPVANAANSGTACPGSMVQLFASPVADGIYEWREAGSPQVISFEQNPVLLLTDSTTFELTVKSSGCDTEVSVFTTVNTFPVPSITGLSGGGSYCEGSSVHLSAINAVPLSGSVQYTWSGPGGFSYTNQTNAEGPFPLEIAVLQSQNEGAYTLTLESQEGCQSASQSVTVDYVEMPLPPVLTVSDHQLCEGDFLQLDASGYSANVVVYQWFFGDGVDNTLLGTTTVPTFFQTDVTPANAGFYFVKVKVDGCEPPSSNIVVVSVTSLPEDLFMGNTTAAVFPACEGEGVQLFTEFIAGASYSWYGPAGFQSFVHNPMLEEVVTSQAGDYVVVVGIPGCTAQLSASTTVFINPLPEGPVLMGTAEICEGEISTFSIANLQSGTVYDLYAANNILVASGTTGTFTINNLNQAHSGVYYAISTKDGCSSAPSQPFEMTVTSPMAELAFAGNDLFVCEGENGLALEALSPVSGTGTWLSFGAAKTIHPNQPTTPVIDLQPGANLFVWQVENAVCDQLSVDTVVVFVETITTVDDHFFTALNVQLPGVDLLQNDDTQSVPNREFFILKQPAKGTIREDGTGIIDYRPFPNAFGVDSFQYSICSMDCPWVCDTALVKISIEDGNGNPGDCFVPNLITPNSDGFDEVFIIPCTVSYPGSSLLVFNRYGSKIFETGNYSNDWDGTFNGQPLPVGTYYYHLALNDGQRTVLKGFVSIFR